METIRSREVLLLSRWFYCHFLTDHFTTSLGVAAVTAELARAERALDLFTTGRAEVLEWHPPLGRGRSTPGASRGLASPSPWESSWLRVARLDVSSPSAAAAGLGAIAGWVRPEPVNGAAVAILCQPSRERAAELAALLVEGLAPDDKGTLDWVRWLAGQGPLPTRLPEEGYPSEERASRSVRLALERRWAEARAELPTRFRRNYPGAVRAMATDLMMGQITAQLCSHVHKGRPEASAIAGSLRSLFGFWGRGSSDPWWNGQEVVARLPLLGLHGLLFSPAASGVELLYPMRELNEHLVNPPSPTFQAPDEIRELLGRYVGVLRAAAAAGGGVVRRPYEGKTMDDGGYLLDIRKEPAPGEG